MFNLEFGGNGDTHPVTSELIKQSIEALDEKQKDFVNRCLEVDPKKRPTLKELLFHPLLFEVPSLRLLASHQLIKNESRGTHTLINIFWGFLRFFLLKFFVLFLKKSTSTIARSHVRPNLWLRVCQIIQAHATTRIPRSLRSMLTNTSRM